ncbi:Olfactomedin-like domain-containing protein [Aphelenchoides besseyi]|nr:Olfactomedin-like domain-containing protein [Aphelenchoides besseyi]
MPSPTVNVLIGLAVVLVLTTLIQRHQIVKLQSQLQSVHHRAKREIQFDVTDDVEQLVPLYTKLSHKSMTKICKEYWSSTYRRNLNRTKPKHPPAVVKASITQKLDECAPIVDLNVGVSWKRPHSVGSGIKCGKSRLLVTEFSGGYSLFSYSKNILEYPQTIDTLPEAFYGTDHTAICSKQHGDHFIYYATAVGWKTGSLIKFDLKKNTEIRAFLNVTNEPLYNATFSTVDLEVEQNWVWVIYRLPTNEMAIAKLSIETLKQLGNGWVLNDPRLQEASNTFVSCGILYSVNFDYSTNNQIVSAVYNLNSNHYISAQPQKLQWKSSSAQLHTVRYDFLTDSLDVFENGQIYEIRLKRQN